MSKTRDDLFTDAVQTGKLEEPTGRLGETPHVQSKMAKRQAKTKNTAARLEREVAQEGKAIMQALDSGPLEVPGLSVVPEKPKKTKKEPAEKSATDRAVASCAVVRRRIDRYITLARSKPDRYGEVNPPKIPNDASLEELKRVEKVVREMLGNESAKITFMQAMQSLPTFLEGLSLQGTIPLNLIGLEERLIGDEGPANAEFSVTEEYRNVCEELAIGWDSMFNYSPEVRMLLLVAGNAVQIHNRNMAMIGSSNQKPDDGE